MLPKKSASVIRPVSSSNSGLPPSRWLSAAIARPSSASGMPESASNAAKAPARGEVSTPPKSLISGLDGHRASRPLR